MKKIYLFIISLTFFSFLIFFIGSYFFGNSENKMNEYIENTYIDQNLELLPLKKETYNELIKDNIILSEKERKKILDLEQKEKVFNDKNKTILNSANNIKFSYFPEKLEYSILDYSESFKVFLNNKNIINKIDSLEIEFYKEKEDVRGKMKNYSIKLFGIEEMEKDECNAVGIHELGHYIDLYFLKKELFTDISEYYYNISWEYTKIMKPGLVQADFVSGYSMTNKYEDFAETFTYFIIHNKDFLEKTKKSEILKLKYDFFTKYLFRNKEFKGSDFSLGNKIESYYRDITKIDFSLKNFLEFLKK